MRDEMGYLKILSAVFAVCLSVLTAAPLLGAGASAPADTKEVVAAPPAKEGTQDKSSIAADTSTKAGGTESEPAATTNSKETAPASLAKGGTPDKTTMPTAAKGKGNASSAEKDPVGDLVSDPMGTFSRFCKKLVKDNIRLEEFSFWRIIYFAIGIALTLACSRITRWLVERYGMKLAGKTKTDVDDLTCEALGRPSGLLVFAIGLYISTYPMMKLLSPTLQVVYGRICLALAASSVAWGLYRMVTVVDHVLTKLAAKTDTNLDDLIVAIVRKSLKVTVVLFSVFFIGQNILHLNITTLLAGAGVAGLAVAFAAQDTISNFFGSIMIILDQPFTVGDCVQFSNYKGMVENVGFRSTRIRTFDGHLVSIPNKNVAGADIENISARPFIKRTFNIGLVYDSGIDKIDRAVELLHDIFDKQECMVDDRPPRIVFDSFGDWSLNISATIWWYDKDEDGEVVPPDFGKHMKWVHETNMEILRRFDKEGLEFAFPTNTTYLARDAARAFPALEAGRDEAKR